MSSLDDLQEEIIGMRADLARLSHSAEVASSAADRIASQAPSLSQSAQTASVGIGRVGDQAQGAVDAANHLGTGAESIGTGIQQLGPSVQSAASTLANSADRGLSAIKVIAMTATATVVGMLGYDAFQAVKPLVWPTKAVKRNAAPVGRKGAARRSPKRRASR